MTYEYESQINGGRFESPRVERWPLVEQNTDLQVALISSLVAGRMLRSAFPSKYVVRIKDDKSEFTPFDEQAEALATDIIRRIDPDATIMSEEIAPNQDISSGNFWVIDGLDGTTNFSRGIPICNFTMAKVEGGKAKIGVVYDFLNGDMYYAVKDQGAYKNGERISVSDRPFSESVITFAPLRYIERNKGIKEKEAVDALRAGMDEITDKSGRFHREFQSGALELAWVAEGKLDGYASSWTNPWDLSAGVLLVKESGGIATNILGDEWEPSYWGVIAGNPKVHQEILNILQKFFNKKV